MFVAQSAGYNVECNGGGARPSDDGFEVQAYLGVGCGGLSRYLLAVNSDGSVEKLERTRIKEPQAGCVVGRRPVGLAAPTRKPCQSAGEYLARAATLEAASVEAFRRLAAELRAHGAPARLVAAALAAARDEVRHAQVTARLARRMGARPERPVIAPSPLRELEAIASENAWEGCVRETFGALEGRWMALHAGDPSVRRAYRRIAEDELRHAALSWRVARWIEPRLEESAQKRVSEVRRAALAELQSELAAEVSEPIRLACGVPSARAARQLFAALSPSLS
jgi:rubrerythrin